MLLGVRSSTAVKAENLFLRKQLALYVERKTKPRRASDVTRLTLAFLARLFAWRTALTIVKPETLIGWHRTGYRLLWRWKSRPRGTRPLPAAQRALIVEMDRSNPIWREERIAAELLLKLAIRVSPGTVNRYLPDDRGSGEGLSSQCWMALYIT